MRPQAQPPVSPGSQGERKAREAAPGGGPHGHTVTDRLGTPTPPKRPSRPAEWTGVSCTRKELAPSDTVFQEDTRAPEQTEQRKKGQNKEAAVRVPVALSTEGRP